jgi:hypothetical protein
VVQLPFVPYVPAGHLHCPTDTAPGGEDSPAPHGAGSLLSNAQKPPAVHSLQVPFAPKWPALHLQSLTWLEPIKETLLLPQGDAETLLNGQYLSTGQSVQFPFAPKKPALQRHCSIAVDALDAVLAFGPHDVAAVLPAIQSTLQI